MGALLVAVAVVVAITPMATAIDPAATAPGTDSGYLVKIGAGETVPSGFEVIREVGFGWSLAKSLTTEPAPRSRLMAADDPRVEPNIVYELFDEPRFAEQWALENIGQTGGTPDADIDITAAWDRTTGDSEVVIAILDSGIDLDHEDLVSQLWTNPGEIAGNGIDDDGNGYVDDIHGWDAIEHDGEPQDELWHGTAVAGVAAAAVNSVGMAGVAPDTSIMAVRVCDDSCPQSAILAGISYAIYNGASILNLSFGSYTASQGFVDALAAAEAAGAIVVAAAGNHGTDNDVDPTYPANYDFENIISVAATDHFDQLAVFGGLGSNYGEQSVDLAAPGGSVLTTLPGGWAEASGTSFAAPHVAGTIALIEALRPGVSTPRIREFVLDSVDVVPQLDGLVATGGRLNASRALDLASVPVAAAEAIPAAGTVPFSVTLDGTRSYAIEGTIVDYTWHLPGGGTLNGATVDWIATTTGLQVVELEVTDNEGLTDRDQVFVDANAAPTAVASGTPTLGWAPLSVAVSSHGSDDPDGEIIDWKWSSGSATAVGPETTIVIADVGQHEIELTVTDGFYGQASDRLTVLVGADFVDTRSSVFRLDIAWASALGITTGCNPPTSDRYCPKNPVTRAQMAGFLTRSLDLPAATHWAG